MKSKKLILAVMLLFLFLVGFLQSCKKADSKDNLPHKSADPIFSSNHKQQGLGPEGISTEKIGASQNEVKKTEIHQTIKNGLAETNYSKVTANVDKMAYSSGEKIIITIKNDSKESIFSHIGSGSPVFAIQYIQRKTVKGLWQNLYAQCQYPHCIFDIDPPAEVKPRESASFNWNPLIFINGTRETAPLKSGEYRLVILFEDFAKKEWIEIYTNVFKIK